jgi:hypothetical protein
MIAFSKRLGILIAAVVSTAGLAHAAEGTPVSEETLTASISALRNVNADTLYLPGVYPVKDDVRHAREVIAAHPRAGLALLKAEVEKVLASPEPDFVFLQEAAGLAWTIGGAGEVDYILSLWRVIPPALQSNGVYCTAIDAACTRTPAALPLMEACLRNREGEFYTPERGIYIRWPLTVKMVWAAYGPAGWPVLLEVLRSPEEEAARHSALVILTQTQYLPALPVIRELARDGSSPLLRQAATAALGCFGHPDDFEPLTAGLSGLDDEDLWQRAYALFEYEDLRAAPLLAPKLASQDKDARFEVIAALSHLLTPVSIRALYDYCAAPPDKMEERRCKRIRINLLKELGMELGAFLALPAEEQQLRTDALVEKMNVRYRPTSGKEGFDRAAFLALQAGWLEGMPIFSEGSGGLAPGDFIKASAPEDLPLFYQVLAAEYTALTEESWGDINLLEDLLKRTGRKRYRAEVALTAKVAAP